MKFTNNNRNRFYRIKQHLRDHTFRDLRVMDTYMDTDVQMLRRKHVKRFTFVFQELQEMIEKHRSKNEAWLRARAEENDRERRELCSLRVSKHVTWAFFHFLHSCYVWLQRPPLHADLMAFSSSGGGAANAGEAERGAERHPATQQTPPVHHAAVQRAVRNLHICLNQHPG